jgi:hypothetical protein
MARALRDRDAHGIKFADAAVDVFRRTGDRAALDVGGYAVDVIARD